MPESERYTPPEAQIEPETKQEDVNYVYNFIVMATSENGTRTQYDAVMTLRTKMSEGLKPEVELHLAEKLGVPKVEALHWSPKIDKAKDIR
jgi:hypothetical protein